MTPQLQLPTTRQQQTGSILVQFGLMLLLLITILGIVDIGYMYYAKRDLQRIADQAAIDAAQYIEYNVKVATDPKVDPCRDAGNASLSKNWPIAITRDDKATQVICGNWNSVTNPAPHYFSATSGKRNAAHVTVQGKTPTIIPGPWDRVIFAESIARKDAPLAVFSVGTTLTKVGCAQQLAPLVQILKIVGANNPCVTVGGYEGLVGVKITPGGLLKALGLPLEANLTVADLNDLLSAKKVKLGALLDAALTLGGHQEFLGLNTQLLSLLRAQLGVDALNLDIPLGSGPNGPGIFASIHSPDGGKDSALDAQVELLDIITAAVGVGTAGRGVSVPGLSVAIPGILPNLLQVKAGIIEPPSVGIGGVGATAYNAQVRLYADIDTGGGLLGGLLQLLQTRIKLPIFVDVARAKATIDEITCRVPGTESSARIRVDASVAQACIGKTSGNPFSITTPICESIQNESLISVLGLIKINNKVNVDALKVSYGPQDVRVGETWTTKGNPLNLGTLLKDLVDELLRLLGEQLGSPNGGQWTPAESSDAASKMASYYLSTDPRGTIPKNQSLGLLGPSGAYNVNLLRDRLKADIDRSTQSCFILPFLCWTNNEWNGWASDVQSANVASGRACWGNPPEGRVLAGIGGEASDVSHFNQCVERELKEALLETPNSKPNFLQVLLGPLLELLAKLLDPLGNLLAGPVLRDLLGIELGVNDVKVDALGCGNAQLVY